MVRRIIASEKALASSDLVAPARTLTGPETEDTRDRATGWPGDNLPSMDSRNAVLPRKPEARTYKVEDLVRRTLEGKVRVPVFQRSLKWRSRHVIELFDSLYRGYPVGSLLFTKRSASAGRVLVGPILVNAPELSQAWWVVDGQQRITALTVCLGRDLPLPTRATDQDPYVLYFDAERQSFEAPPASNEIPTTWVPVPELLDGSSLTEWAFTWQHRDDQDLRRAVFEAGARLREYPIPLYLIETEDEEIAEKIFYRTNKSGVPLEWTEVHDALFGSRGPAPSTLSDLAEDLSSVGLGRLSEKRLLTCLLALRGHDPTRTLAKHLQRDPAILRDAVQEALPILRDVFSFLRADVEIPHLELLPKSILLDVLVRFFARHREPNARTRTLLARWFWRTVLGAGVFDERTLRRRGIDAVTDDEEASAQNLVALVRKEPARRYELPTTFDPRSDASRIALLALAHRRPRDLETGELLNVASLIETHGKKAFGRIFGRPRLALGGSPANRLFQAPGKPIDQRLRLLRATSGESVLASHLMDSEMVEHLDRQDHNAFLERRAEVLTEETRRFGDRLAAWEQNDRPSVEALLAHVGAQD